MVVQSTHGSVTEHPYFSFDGSAGIGWLPHSRLLSTIQPMIERLPWTTWASPSFRTSGCSSGFLYEFECAQSITRLRASPACCRAASASATLTVS